MMMMMNSNGSDGDTRFSDSLKKREDLPIIGLSRPGETQGENKRNERNWRGQQEVGTYWRIKKLYNMKVTVIPIVIDRLGTIPKRLITGLKQIEMRGWAETINRWNWNQ